ncbi:hypothetical protein [Streptomyces sp. ODS28]|uniref:bestrophin-like domain n=1 Tax=Streptomyces sp. ODS28 TaxID=3136688 RepID=UPI0031ECAF76
MLAVPIVVVVLALVAAFVAHFWLRARVAGEDEDGLKLSDMVGPLQTLTVLLLAFTLVTASGSYRAAVQQARVEANAVDHLNEVSDYAPASARRQLGADIACYARAVRSYEWPAMREGDSSPVPSVWSTHLRSDFKKLMDEPSFGMLVSADNERAKARQERLAEANPAIPEPVFWFLLVCLVLTLVALGLALPRRRAAAQLTGMVVFAVLLGGALVIIRDVDYAFGGAVSVQPTAISDVARQAARDYATDHDISQLPCDEKGAPKSA